MKMLKTAVLVAMLTMNVVAQRDNCGAGYQNQFMDDDSPGYCTRIPNLKEQADRAEAFVLYGLHRYENLCQAVQIDTCTCTNKLHKWNEREDQVTELTLLTNKMATLILEKLTFENDSSQDAKRLRSAINQMQEAMKTCLPSK